MDRPRPIPSITIPEATAESPLFSAYPILTPEPKSPPIAPPQPQKDADTPEAEDAPSSSSEHSSATWPRRRNLPSNSAPQCCDENKLDASQGASSSGSGSSSALTNLGQSSRTDSTLSLTRRRSTSVVGLIKRAQEAAFGIQSPPKPGHLRRASLNSGDFADSSCIRPVESVGQLDTIPYGYGRDAAADYTRQPPISSSIDQPHALGLLTGLSDDKPLLDLEGLTITPRKETQEEVLFDREAAQADGASFVSEPSTQTSPSVMTKSLPSTKTSLSRSARSGKEGHEEPPQADLSMTARVLLDKRRMILLEIAETEVTYVQDLRSLVQIYLPQLAALPHVSEGSLQLIARNTNDLLDFHVQLAAHMVDILKFQGMGYDYADPQTVEKVTKEFAELFVREETSFTLYNDFCAGSTAAGAYVRTIASRSDYEAFEKRCQYVASNTPHATLRDILAGAPAQPTRTRLRFKDILITPIQRVCRYPLLLASLSADVSRELPQSEVVAEVEKAQNVMRAVAENADEARKRKEVELKSNLIAERMENNAALTADFVRRLGHCRFVGTLETLYHHPTIAPLDSSARVRYLAAFLYRGYLILSKVRRGKVFDPYHYIPLEVFEIVDLTEGEFCVTGRIGRIGWKGDVMRSWESGQNNANIRLAQGFLSHSIRLKLRDHNLDIGCACDAEKELWISELASARDDSTMPPFEMPSSISLAVPRTRHMSMAKGDGERPPAPKRYSFLGDGETPFVMPRTPSKRHTLLGDEFNMKGSMEPVPPIPRSTSLLMTAASRTSRKRYSVYTGAPADEVMQTESPTSLSPSQSFNEGPSSRQSTISLSVSRPTLHVRNQIDRALSNLVSDSIANVRNREAMARPPSIDPRRSILDATSLRRRRSMAEMSGQVNMVAAHVKGVVRSKSRRTFTIGDSENGNSSGASGETEVLPSRSASYTSVTEAVPTLHKLHSSVSLRRGFGHKRDGSNASMMSAFELPRAKSVPSSPKTPRRKPLEEVEHEDDFVLVPSEIPEGEERKSPLTRSLSIFTPRRSPRSRSNSRSASASRSSSPSKDSPPMDEFGAPLPSTDAPRPMSRRRRSIRFLGLKGFTPI